jgi:hypothetical protein
MKMNVLGGAALAAVMLVGACAQPTTGSAADESAVRELGTKYADAFNKSDTAALAALVTEDFQAVRPDGTMTTAGLRSRRARNSRRNSAPVCP